jgi:hypothetical protein
MGNPTWQVTQLILCRLANAGMAWADSIEIIEIKRKAVTK